LVEFFAISQIYFFHFAKFTQQFFLFTLLWLLMLGDTEMWNGNTVFIVLLCSSVGLSEPIGYADVAGTATWRFSIILVWLEQVIVPCLVHTDNDCVCSAGRNRNPLN
jgi:hypothetical protein